jgi:hypothetical protein
MTSKRGTARYHLNLKVKDSHLVSYRVRNPAYLVRPPFFHVPGRLPRPIPIIGFARPRPPLLGGVIAVKREIVYFRVVEGGLFQFAKADC